MGVYMDNYKDKYDNIVSKLLELVAKERELDKAEKELEVNLEKTKICSDELSKLVGKIYEMKHSVVSKKSLKCMNRALLFSLISGLVFVYIGVNFLPSLWLVIVYIILNIIAHHNIYIKKVNDKDYMVSELEQSLEYRELVEQKDLKRQELNDLTNEEEMLNELIIDLYLETEYLHTMIYGFIDEEEIQRGIDEALKKGKELEIKYAESRGLVKRRIKKNID